MTSRYLAARRASIERSGSSELPEPMERDIADAIAFGVAFIDVGLDSSADWGRGKGAGVEPHFLDRWIVKMDLASD